MIITGDIHADFGQLNRFINKKHPDIIISCGDFGYWPIYNKIFKNDVELIKPQNTKIYWCDGNHEHHDMLTKLVKKHGRKPIEVVPNVFYVPRGTILTFNNKNFLFMGGADSIDKQYRKIKIDWFPQEIVTEKDINNIQLNKKIDVVISHTCPYDIVNQCILSNPNYANKFNDPSSHALQLILEDYKPKEWFFGHWHTYFKTTYKNCSFTCLNMLNQSNWWIEYE